MTVGQEQSGAAAHPAGPTGGERARGHTLGVLLVLGSAIAFSLTGTLTKLIQADAWIVLCWRGFVGGLLIALYAIWRKSERRRLDWRGWLLASVGALASIAFIAAFKLTYVANVAMIYATVPFVAAALEWRLLREPFRRGNLLAALASLTGVAIIAAGSLGPANLLGTLAALAMTAGCGLYMVLIRAFRDQPVVLAAAASSAQLVALGWLVADPFDVTASDAWLLLLFGASFALAVVLWTEGTRRIPAAESGLLGAADVPLAVIFAWLILSELPPVATLIGGAVVLAAVLARAGVDLLRGGPRRRKREVNRR